MDYLLLNRKRIFKVFLSQKIYSTTLTSILLILLLTSVSTAQYTRLISKFKNYSIYTTASWDTTLYVAAGWSPELAISRDGWETVSYKPFNYPVGDPWQDNRKIDLINPSTIFLNGTARHFVSRDTGNTWTALQGSYPSRMVFSSPREGMYCSQGKVHFTLDSGNTWNEANMPTNVNGYIAIGIFPNGNMLARYGYNLLTSTDSGTTWSSQSLPLKYDDDIACLWGNSNGFYSSGNVVNLTTNSGVTWSPVHTTTDVLRIFYMSSPDSVYVFNRTTSQLLLYRNYFSSHELLHQFSTGARLDDLSFASRSKVIAVTYGDSLDRLSVSNDGGHTFTPVEPNHIDRIYSLKFFNSLEGQLIYDAPLQTFFTSTSDGGLTWSAKVPIEPFNGFSESIYPESRNSVLFIDQGVKKVLRYTPDTGYTTIFRSTSGTQSPRYLYKYGDSTIFVCSDSLQGSFSASNLWKSTNDGRTWELIHRYDNGYYLNSIYMHNDSTGFGTLKGNVIRITKGGRSWEGIPMFHNPALTEVPSFYRVIKSFNDSTVFVELGRSIYKTTNSGKNWHSRQFNDANDIRDADFISQDTGYVILLTSDPFPLRVTTNGGLNWLGVYWVDSVYNPQFLSVTDSNKLFLATTDEIFVTNNLGGQPLDLKENDRVVDMPIEFELSQNWPNPFNPSTSIGYYLPESGIVKVSVYNIMGELVNSQQPEFVQQGHHIIKFDGSHLPSGVYILNVTFAGQRRSIKMLLLK
jgi:photosystem II stability/assembly factor-like uncharacterized protein